MIKPTKWAAFSLLKASEGGFSFKDAKAALDYVGIACRRQDSPYVGHYGIAVPARQARRAERILFGR